MSIEILSPHREVKLADRTVLVRELNWRDQRAVLKDIETQVAQLIAAQHPDAKTSVPEAVLEMLRSSQDLSERILVKTTVLNVEEIGDLSLSEFTGLLDVALELNISTLAAGSKKVFGRITSFVGKSAAGTPTAAPTMA